MSSKKTSRSPRQHRSDWIDNAPVTVTVLALGKPLETMDPAVHYLAASMTTPGHQRRFCDVGY